MTKKMRLFFYSFQPKILPIKTLEQSDHKLERPHLERYLTNERCDLKSQKCEILRNILGSRPQHLTYMCVCNDFSQRNLFVDCIYISKL